MLGQCLRTSIGLGYMDSSIFGLAGAPQALAVYGYHLPCDPFPECFSPLHQTVGQLLRPDQAKHPPDGVRRRRAILKHQKLAQPCLSL